jgi:hypothetical protein
MKKLISMFLACFTITSTTTSLVACNATPNSSRNEDDSRREHDKQLQNVYANWKKKLTFYRTDVNWRDLEFNSDNFDYVGTFNEIKDRVYIAVWETLNKVDKFNFQVNFKLSLSEVKSHHITISAIKIDGTSFDNFDVPWLLWDDQYQENDREAVNEVINNIDNQDCEAIIKVNDTVVFFKNPNDVSNNTNQKIISDLKGQELIDVQREFERSFAGDTINFNDPIFEIVTNKQVNWAEMKLNIALSASSSNSLIFDTTIHKNLVYKIETEFNNSKHNNISSLLTSWGVNNGNDFDSTWHDKTVYLEKGSTASIEEQREVLRDFVNYCYQQNISTNEIDLSDGIWNLSNLKNYLPPFIDAEGNDITEVNFWENEL